MAKKPPRIDVITGAAASWVFGVSLAELRRVAIAGAVPVRRVKHLGPRTCNAYDLTACRQRWPADPERLSMLARAELLQIDSRRSAIWNLYSIRPSVTDDDGNLATEFEESK